METKARFTVDADHCRRAADELCEILRAQERGFLERWNAARATREVIVIARWIGVSVSLLGLLLVGGERYFETRSWASQLWSIPVFVVFTLIFIFMPWWIAGLQRWSFNLADKRARRNANRCLKQALRLVPYEAEFDFRGELLLYMRGKEGAWQLAWSRMLRKFRDRGVAIQGESITAIFRRPGSLYPSVLILQRDRDWTGSILQEAGITVSRFPLPDQRIP